MIGQEGNINIRRMSGDITDEIIQVVGAQNVLLGIDLKERYVHIWRMDESLEAKALVTPRSAEDVSKIVAICHRHGQPILTHGGLTNLVGSTESNGDEIVISLEKLADIIEVDEMSRSMTVNAGVTIERAQNAAKEVGLIFPLNFGAKGSAHIGGAISTNAGGLRVFKYGMTRNLILGIEAVLADGTIISSIKKIIKDNSGYDLKQMFIGTEGTLGIITKAVLKLSEAPKSRVSAYVGFNDYEKVVGFLKFMDAGLAGNLSGFELIWKYTYQCMTGPRAQVGPPLPYDYDYYVLLESLGADLEKDRERVEELLANAIDSGLILDAVMASNSADLNWFWTIREDVHVLKAQIKNEQHFDISLPIPLIGKRITKILSMLEQIKGVSKIFTFGHVADGNIHLIVGKDYQAQELINKINDVVYEELENIGGSISAEHGIGVHKKEYLKFSRSPEEIAMMKTIKVALDPKNILNPGKIFDI